MKREDFIKSKIKECGYTLKEFAMIIDMPYTTLLSIVNKSVGGAALDNIIKICNGLNISIEDLNPYRIEHGSTDFDNAYNKLNKLGKAKVDAYIDGLIENKDYVDKLGVKPPVHTISNFDAAVDITDMVMTQIQTDKDKAQAMD